MHKLIGGVDRDRALALRVANIRDELAAVRAARIVEVPERHLDGFGAGLPVFSRRAGQLHHEADGNRALVRARRAAERERKNRRRDKSRTFHFLPSSPTLA